jgi:murein endopeptidase
VLALALLATRVAPNGESRAQEADVMATHEIERMKALNQGGDPAPEPIRWRRSRAVGKPFAGHLERGVRLPRESAAFFTWDPIRKTAPNRWWRRYGTDRLLRTVLEVLGEFQDEHPDAPRVGVGDLSRPGGGDFGPRFGAPGHASHQNGLDVDVYYPRVDGLERAPIRVAQVDRALAQELVDRFVAAGAQFVFVGRHVGLRGPPKVVQAIPHHDNHLHVRLWP